MHYNFNLRIFLFFPLSEKGYWKGFITHPAKQKVVVKELNCHTAFQPCTSPYAVPLLRILFCPHQHLPYRFKLSLALSIHTHTHTHTYTHTHTHIIFFYSQEIFLDLLKPCQFLPLNDLINHDPLLHNFSSLQLNIYFCDHCICVHTPFVNCKPHEDGSSIVVMNVCTQWSAWRVTEWGQ